MVLKLGLSKEDRRRLEDNVQDIILHPGSLKETQDILCSKIFWNSEGHGSGIGKWSCVLREEKYGDVNNGGGNENKDYLECDCSDYNSCGRFK